MSVGEEWTQSDQEILKTMWLGYKSGKVISVVLGRSRSAVMGKISRMGIKRTGPKPPRSPNKKEPALKEKKNKPIVKEKKIEIVVDNTPLDYKQNIQMRYLKEKQCRYPTGDIETGMTFCGRVSDKDSSYCPEHRKLCTRIPPKRKVHPCMKRC